MNIVINVSTLGDRPDRRTSFITTWEILVRAVNDFRRSNGICVDDKDEIDTVAIHDYGIEFLIKDI